MVISASNLDIKIKMFQFTEVHNNNNKKKSEKYTWDLLTFVKSIRCSDYSVS